MLLVIWHDLLSHPLVSQYAALLCSKDSAFVAHLEPSIWKVKLQLSACVGKLASS